MVEFLLEKGASPNFVGDDGQTALVFTMMSCPAEVKEKVVKALLDHGLKHQLHESGTWLMREPKSSNHVSLNSHHNEALVYMFCTDYQFGNKAIKYTRWHCASPGYGLPCSCFERSHHPALAPVPGILRSRTSRRDSLRTTQARRSMRFLFSLTRRARWHMS